VFSSATVDAIDFQLEVSCGCFLSSWRLEVTTTGHPTLIYRSILTNTFEEFMQIRVNLMGGLKAQAPENNSIDLPDGSTIDDLLAALEVDPAVVQTVMLNNKPQKDRTRVITADDELTLLPPVGGG
jgi:molybdopterin converting factor small subunit